MATEDKGQNHMTDETPGKMNIEMQEKTFEGFLKVVTWTTIIIVATLIFIALINA